MDLKILTSLLQYIITIAFFLLAGIGLIQKDYNFGFAMNFILALLYVILYFKPLP